MVDMQTTRNVDRARAWLVTVVEPLLRSFAIEEGHLEREHWTWRFDFDMCELLRPTRRIVGSHYGRNLGDLTRKHPELANVLDARDRGLDELVRALRAAQGALEDDLAFRAAVESARSEYSRVRPGGPLPPRPEKTLVSLAAQHVLNDIDPSSSFSTGAGAPGAESSTESMRSFWADHGATLRRLGEARAEAIKPLGRTLLTAVRAARAAVEQFERDLCDAFDLPPVPVDD